MVHRISHPSLLREQSCLHMTKAGQNRIYTPYTTVYSVISLPKIPNIYTVYLWFWPTLHMTHRISYLSPERSCSSVVHRILHPSLSREQSCLHRISHLSHLYPVRGPGCLYPVRGAGCLYPVRGAGCLYPVRGAVRGATHLNPVRGAVRGATHLYPVRGAGCRLLLHVCAVTHQALQAGGELFVVLKPHHLSECVCVCVQTFVWACVHAYVFCLCISVVRTR